MTIETFRDRYGESNLLDELSLEESSAFADLAILVVLSDREVSEEELDALSEQLLSLAFDDESEIEEAYGDRAREVKATVSELLEDEADGEVDRFIRERANLLTGGAYREEALEMLATLAYADGLEPSEEDVCFQIGRAFGFPREMVHVTFDEVADG